MKNSISNTLVLLLIALLLGGGGYYLTEVRQPKRLDRIEEQDREARLRNARVEELLQMESQNEAVAEGTLQKWRSRYKVIPGEISTADVVQYLERLTSRGFDQITIDRVNERRTPDVSSHAFKVQGTAYFRSLVDLVWQLENNREFYHVRDLSIDHNSISDENPDTGLQRRVDMVRFGLEVDAFFAGAEGLTPPKEELAEVPRSLLPARHPAHDSFHPIIRTDLPPNDRGLLDLDQAVLISIIGGNAVFREGDVQRVLSEGDEVYLGSIVKVDPIRAFVRASLNKGGIIDVVEIKLSADQQLRLPGALRRTPIRAGGESGG